MHQKVHQFDERMKKCNFPNGILNVIESCKMHFVAFNCHHFSLKMTGFTNQ